jgi:hypothetical protein
VPAAQPAVAADSGNKRKLDEVEDGSVSAGTGGTAQGVEAAEAKKQKLDDAKSGP